MKQPYPMAPGSTEDFAWDFRPVPGTPWLKDGDSINSGSIVLTTGPHISASTPTLNGDKVVVDITLAENACIEQETWCRCTVTSNTGKTTTKEMRFVATYEG